jgi:hypothetical protein
MKVGDLVRYKHYHSTLKDVRGVVREVRYKYGYGCRTPERVRVIWNDPLAQDGLLDWADDLETIDESR